MVLTDETLQTSVQAKAISHSFSHGDKNIFLLVYGLKVVSRMCHAMNTMQAVFLIGVDSRPVLT